MVTIKFEIACEERACADCIHMSGTGPYCTIFGKVLSYRLCGNFHERCQLCLDAEVGKEKEELHTSDGFSKARSIKALEEVVIKDVESCETCRYFHRVFVSMGDGKDNQETKYGECKRYPPMIILGKTDPCFPETGIGWLCGEYKLKEGC